MKIAIAADHAGVRLKAVLAAHLRAAGHTVIDFGTDSEAPVDYPDFIGPAAESVAAGTCEAGIVLGGSGNGEAMVANKFRGTRCAVCWTEESARLAKEHNDANMIAIGARLVAERDAVRIVDTWLGAAFAAGRHLRRIRKIDRLGSPARPPG